MSFTSLAGRWGLLFLLLHLLIAGIAAVAVHRDAKSRDDLFLDLHPIWWGGMVFLGSIAGLAVYWVMHYSSLCRPDEDANASESTDG